MALHSLRRHLSENLTLAVPVMLSNLGHVLMGVIDNAMVGQLGAVSLAAAGLATVAFNVLLLFGIGVSYAITPLVAEGNGQNDTRKIADTLRHGLIINTTNGFVLAAIVFLARPVLHALGQPPEVVEEAIPFLNVLGFSLIPLLVYQSFKQFAEGLGHTRVALAVVLGTNVVNVALNYALIYGNFGFPPLGLQGAGIATLISRVLMAVAIAAYIYFSPRYARYRDAFGWGTTSRSLFRTMLGLGVPSGLQFILEVAAFDLSLVMSGWLGTHQQAAHQIVINMASLSYMVTAGLAAAATVRVSYFAGTGDAANLQRAAYTLLALALATMALFAGAFIAGRDFLPSVYIDDPEVIRIAAGLMIIAGLFQLSDGTQVVCNGALRGLKDVRVPSVFIFVSYWIVGLPLGYALGFEFGYGTTGIWTGLLIGLTLTAAAMYARFRKLLQKQAAAS